MGIEWTKYDDEGAEAYVGTLKLQTWRGPFNEWLWVMGVSVSNGEAETIDDAKKDAEDVVRTLVREAAEALGMEVR